MSATIYTSSGELLIAVCATLSLLVVVYLIRLQIRQFRKSLRMAEKGLDFGLVQHVTVTGNLLTKGSLPALTPRHPAAATVLDLDMSVNRWTRSPAPTVLDYRWN